MTTKIYIATATWSLQGLGGSRSASSKYAFTDLSRAEADKGRLKVSVRDGFHVIPPDPETICTDILELELDPPAD